MTMLAEKKSKYAYGQRSPIVVVLIPCLNEAPTIRNVISEFRESLPDATIFVYDNGSSDDTVEIARAAGAVVRKEPMRGKGNVVRRMFSDVEADVFILVDGDGTYDARNASQLVQKLVKNSLDMVNAVRVSDVENAYRHGHKFGNYILTSLVGFFFGNRLTDLLSGYRVLSRRFVKTYPVLASGFEIETELSVHALQMGMPIEEVPLQYRERPEGSVSKLNTYKDGIRILRTIAFFVKEGKPLAFFSLVSGLLMTMALFLGIPVVTEFMETGLVPRFPTAILASALMILAFLSFECGLIVDSVRLGRIEVKRLAYLRVPLRFNYDKRSLRDQEAAG